MEETFCTERTVKPVALRMAKTLWSFGHSECSRAKNLSEQYIALLLRFHMYEKLVVFIYHIFVYD